MEVRFALAALALLPLCVSFQAGVLPLRQPLPLAGEHVAPRVATTPLGTYMQNVPSLVAARLTFESVIEGVGGSKSFPAVTVTRPGAYGFAAKTNQDAFIVSSAPMMGAIMDGHGANGHNVSAFLKEVLPRRLESVIPANAAIERNLTVAIKKVAVEAQADVCEAIDCTLSGSTCVMAFLVAGEAEGGWNAVVANIGDSRAVLALADPDRHPLGEAATNGAGWAGGVTWEDASMDHKPGDPPERLRIQAAGGWVGLVDAAQQRMILLDESADDGYAPGNHQAKAPSLDGLETAATEELTGPIHPMLNAPCSQLRKAARIYVPQTVVPGLSVARAFGDQVSELYTFPSPDVVVHPLTDLHRFLLIASDGVWEVMSSEEAVEVVGGASSPRQGAERVVDECTARWTASRYGNYRDDITILVISLL